MPTHLLIDGNSLTYRAFYALPDDMKTASGQVTNAVFGFTSMLIYVLNEQQPDGVLVAFDRPEPTFRHEAEPAYKAQRETAPDILKQQMGLVREVLDALGIQQVEAAGWEADDLIATAAHRLSERGDHVIIVTGDRDSYQLVRDPDIKVMYNKRGVSDYALYDEAGIAERTGVTPALYPQYAALRGDNSDNLPGVPGVGEKTAAKLINSYGGIDGIYEHLDDQTPKLRENLAANEDRVRRNFELMLLRDDAPLDGVDLDDLAVSPHPEETKRLFDFLEFRTLADRLDNALGGTTTISSTPRAELSAGVRHIVEPAEAAALIEAIGTLDIVGAWDGEPGRSDLMGVAVVIPDTATDDEAQNDDTEDGEVGGSHGVVAWLDVAVVVDPLVAKALESHQSVRGHRAKQLMRSLLDHDIALRHLVLDTAIAAYLIDPAEARYEIGELLEKFTDLRLPESDAAPEGQLDLSGQSRSHTEVAAVHALAVNRMAGPVLNSLEAQGMDDLYRKVENPLVWVLAAMEHAGIAVDVDKLREINAYLVGEAEQISADLKRVTGRSDLNFNSPTQLRALLFDEKGLSTKGIKKTKSGYSTDAQSLAKLRDEWPEFVEPLLRHREIEKLRGTYAEGLIGEVGPDGRIHATFHQTVARTGRLSSEHPNLHNIPVRTDEGRVFREAFVASPGNVLMVADYNQIELRVIAHLSGDPGLTEAFTSGEDIHNATAARVFDVDPDEVTVEQRSKAKMVSYGLAYGMEAYGLGQRLNIPTDEAAVILDAYFVAFPSVKQYMEDVVNEARQVGYTSTLFGRRRPIPELLNSNWRIRQAGERQAMNAGIQGLAADIFKIALIDIDAALRDAGLGAEVVLQVHDEVILDVPLAERYTVGPLVVDLMRSAAHLDVPLEVNVAWGETWAEAKG